MRQGAVWIPDWEVTAAEISGEVPAGTPAAVCGGKGVLAVNAWAKRRGIRPGMSRREAHATCPETVLFAPDPERDMRRFEPILQALDRHIARLTVLEPGNVIFTSRGAVRTAGSEEALAEALIGEIADIAGCEANVGFAEGTLATLLAARESLVLSPAESADYLAAQPATQVLNALPVMGRKAEVEQCIDILARLGIRTLGGINHLGAAALTTRFGAMGNQLWALASGADMRLHPQGMRAQDLALSRSFEPPLQQAEAAAFAARTLAEQLSDEMASRGLTGGQLTITAALESGDDLTRSWMMDGGSARDITDRVRWQLTSWIDTDGGGSAICRLELHMADMLPAGYRPQPLWGGRSAGDELAARTAVRMQALVGEGGVRVAYNVGGRLPADRYEERPWGEAFPSSGKGKEFPWPGGIPDPPPALLHPTPIAIDITDECGHPLHVSGLGVLTCGRGCPDPRPFQLTRCRANASRPANASHRTSVSRGANASPVADKSSRTSRAGEQVMREARAASGQKEVGGQQAPHSQWRILDFAGPWVIEQHWWDPHSAQRRAWLQIAVDAGAVLVYAEAGQWWEAGSYA